MHAAQFICVFVIVVIRLNIGMIWAFSEFIGYLGLCAVFRNAKDCTNRNLLWGGRIAGRFIQASLAKSLMNHRVTGSALEFPSHVFVCARTIAFVGVNWTLTNGTRVINCTTSTLPATKKCHVSLHCSLVSRSIQNLPHTCNSLYVSEKIYHSKFREYKEKLN